MDTYNIPYQVITRGPNSGKLRVYITVKNTQNCGIHQSGITVCVSGMTVQNRPEYSPCKAALIL